MSQGAWSRARGLPLATAPLVALVAFLAAMLLGAELGAREPGAPDDVTLTLDPARWFQERTPTPSVLRDPEGRWTIDDVRDPALAQRFTPEPGAGVLLDRDYAATWVRVDIASQEAIFRDWRLLVSNPHIDYVDLYLADAPADIPAAAPGDDAAPRGP
ncbi:MAG: hypothetical protein KC468_30115, partial [Myxococcales bacterium]|nr:hypothetical protein [Myxococcales bacterium]